MIWNQWYSELSLKKVNCLSIWQDQKISSFSYCASFACVWVQSFIIQFYCHPLCEHWTVCWISKFENNLNLATWQLELYYRVNTWQKPELTKAWKGPGCSATSAVTWFLAAWGLQVEDCLVNLKIFLFGKTTFYLIWSSVQNMKNKNLKHAVSAKLSGTFCNHQ